MHFLKLSFLRSSFLFAASLAIAGTAVVNAQIPAFPGAEGFGAYATGGRGGDVYYVTNLNSSGAGSLRNGIETAPDSGRTIVFAVSGYIPLPGGSAFRMVQDKITIAGQTAPGDGIGLRNGTVRVTGNNVVLRHLRLRHGRNGSGGDCLNLDSSAHDSIIDHVSMMFSTDENISFFNSALNNFTMQYSTSSWGMERHNAGGLWDLQNGSCLHSLWAHHRTRNPKARPVMLEWINNVTYHWRSEGFIMGDSQTPADWKANVIGNTYISIEDPDANFGIKTIGLSKARISNDGVPNFSLYLDDTLLDANDNGIFDGNDVGYSLVAGQAYDPAEGAAPGTNRYAKSATPFPGATGAVAVTVDDPLTAYKKVVSSAGALRLNANYSGPLRDELDTLLIDSLVNQYSVLVQKDGNIAGETTPNNGEQHLADAYGISNGGFGTLNGTTPPTDSDLDGMPDFWEIALNGKDGMSFNMMAGDHNTVFTSGQLSHTFFPSRTPVGYTYLEEYLHFLAVPHAKMAKSTASDPSSQMVDLRKYTDGFTQSPEFTISSVSSNGTIQQFLADGATPSSIGPIVRFTPFENEAGRAGFNFTVTDADGSQWTQQFAILISATAAPRDLIWIGDGVQNTWDDSTTNWQLAGGGATTFSVGDTVLFDDRGSASPSINVLGVQLAGSILVTGNQDYAFSGSGNIASTGALTKASDSTMSLNVGTSFSSGTFLNGGEMVLDDGGNLDGGAIRFTGGSTLTSTYDSSNTLSLDPNIEVAAGAVGNIDLSQRVNLKGGFSGAGTLNLFSPSTLGTEGRVYFDGASADFAGTVNLSGGATAPGNGGRVAFRTNGGSFNGFGDATVNLLGIDVFTRNNSFGNTYPIGALGGDANSRLRSTFFGGETTWEVGGLGMDTEFAGIIMDGTAVTNVNKIGSGTLILSGANSYTGLTSVQGGGLHITGSLGNTATSVAAGATLSGSGFVGSSLTIAQGAVIAPGNNPGEAGAMTIGNGIDLNAATLRFDLSSNPASGNDRIGNNAGTLILRSPGGNAGADFEFTLIDGSLGQGTYILISGGSGTSAPGSPGFTHNLPESSRQSFSLQRSGGGSSDAFVRLVVSGVAGDLTWSGGNGSAWDLSNTINFSGGPSDDNKFYNMDKVTFTDGASTGDVSLTGMLQPREIVVSGDTLNYTIAGSSGSIGGIGSLSKTGDATLTINASATGNDYSGGTTLSGGTLAISGTTPLGSGLITITGGTLALPGNPTFLPNSMHFSGSSAISSSYGGNSTVVNDNANRITSDAGATVDLSGIAGILSINGDMSGFSGALDFGGGSGMLRLNSNSSGSADRNFGSASTFFDLGSTGGSLTNRNGNITIELGSLAGGPSTALGGRQSGSGSTETTYRVGALGVDSSFDGSIFNGGDNLGVHVVKTGTGTWSLGGHSNFVGSTTVEAGTLALSGTLECSSGLTIETGASFSLTGGTIATDSVQIDEGASFSGSGTIDGELINNGTVTTITGTLFVTGPIENTGTMYIKSGAQLTSAGTMINYGILDLLTAGGADIPNLDNRGVVIDSSGLKVVDHGIVGTDFELTIMTYSGHSYQLQYSDSLNSEAWQDLGAAVQGEGSEMTFVHPNGVSGDKRFYRVVVD